MGLKINKQNNLISNEFCISTSVEKKKAMIVVACLLLCILSPAAHAAPNFVGMLTDDHRWDDVGCDDHSVKETPNIGRLATGGMRFTDFHVGASVCTPSRFLIGINFTKGLNSSVNFALV